MSDRFRIFSAQAEGEFQCHEISPRVRLGLEQSGESRRQVRDALGAEEAENRHELGAGGLGMVLRQVGEGGAGLRAVIRCRCIFSGKNGELTSRQESSGKEDSRKLETFQMEPCG